MLLDLTSRRDTTTCWDQTGRLSYHRCGKRWCSRTGPLPCTCGPWTRIHCADRQVCHPVWFPDGMACVRDQVARRRRQGCGHRVREVEVRPSAPEVHRRQGGSDLGSPGPWGEDLPRILTWWMRNTRRIGRSRSRVPLQVSSKAERRKSRARSKLPTYSLRTLPSFRMYPSSANKLDTAGGSNRRPSACRDTSFLLYGPLASLHLAITLRYHIIVRFSSNFESDQRTCQSWLYCSIFCSSTWIYLGFVLRLNWFIPASWLSAQRAFLAEYWRLSGEREHEQGVVLPALGRPTLWQGSFYCLLGRLFVLGHGGDLAQAETDASWRGRGSLCHWTGRVQGISMGDDAMRMTMSR
jgi:hypothetical protein